MSLAGHDTSKTLTRLEVALNAPGIPARAKAGCQSLIEKLRRPVGLGLFGLPGSGKSLILNALAGQAVVPADLPLPTLEITYGPEVALTAVLGDGSTIRRPGLPGPDLLDEGAVFVRVTSPEETLKGLKVLNVVAEPEAVDLEAALTWGAARCDIALWCTRSWDDFEQQIWARAPHSLKNHALMVVTRDPKRSRIKVGHDTGFGQVLHVPPLKVYGLSGVAGRLRAEDLQNLVAKVQTVIDDAVAEDVDSALMFLHRFEQGVAADDVAAEDAADTGGDQPAQTPDAGNVDAPSAPGPAAAADNAVVQLPVAPGRARPAPALPAIPDEAHAALSRAFHYLRQRARGLLDRVPAEPPTPEAAEDLLAQFEDAVVSLVAFTEFEQTIAETWPDLHDAILEASETALLLRIEGGAHQLVEAAALLLQLRQEFEQELAA
ncbi:MAG: hypothetical protein ACWA5A_05780 [Marinibacterium sp.]